jgi:bifunctional UDP-N-acetylglucosamine pyrophosphorylase/glucosamine-1-phosphate N-acetyltransferase
LNVKTAVQKKPMGTADAVMSAKNGFNNFNGYILIINGDVPLLKLSTIKKFITETLKSDSICGVCTMKLQNAGNYGRIIRDFDGHLARIVEAKDATPEELSVNEVNAGIYFVESKWLFETLKNISKDNEQGEYYLTDIIGLAVHNGSRVYAYLADDADEFLELTIDRISILFHKN